MLGFLFVYMGFGLFLANKSTFAVENIDNAKKIEVFLQKYQYLKYLYMPIVWFPLLTIMAINKRLSVSFE